jgi:hypothetical protein
LSNNALECSIMIRVALAINIAELATARKNHGLTKFTATAFAELATTCKKSCTRTNPANMVQQLTKLHNNAAWHRRARFQLQREPLCAMCLAEGKVVAARIADHNDPIRFWNGKLQSLCARIATRAGRSSWRTAALTRQSALMAGRSIYGIRSIGILDSGGLGTLFGGCAFSIPVVCELLEGDSRPPRFADWQRSVR